MSDPIGPQILRDAFDTGFASDLTIRCGPKEWKAHKVIVGLASPVLKVMCTEQRFKEGFESLIVFGNSSKPDPTSVSDDHVAVKYMIRYIYEGDCYPDDEEPYEDSAPHMSIGPLSIYAKLYALGDIYDIPKLKEAACQNFKNETDTISQQEEDFCEAATIAFTTTPSEDTGLRDLIVAVLHALSPNELSKNLMNHIGETPDLAAQLWKRSREEPKSYCKICDTVATRTCNKNVRRFDDQGRHIGTTACGKQFVACQCVKATISCGAH